ncbi:hypothetical protein Tco_0611391 [Tanacetum coccineum]
MYQTQHEEEDVDDRVRTPSDYEFTDYEKLDDEETMDDEEDDEVINELYGDVNMNLGNEDTEMTYAGQEASEHQNLLNLENPSPADNKIASLMETLARHATAIPEITSGFTTTISPPPPFFNPLLQQKTPTSTTTTTTYPIVTLPEIPNFASVFKFDQRVTALESDLSEFMQTNQFAEAVSLILGIVDTYLTSKMKEAVDSTMKAIIKDQVKAQVSKIMPKIEKYVTESLGAKVLVRSTNQPQTSYVVEASLLEFELKKILINKIEANKSIDRSDIQKNLYNSLVESYSNDNEIITSYGDVDILKRGRDDQDKDEDPSAGSDRRTKRRKSGKDVESSKDSRSKEKKSSSTSKDASQSQHKSSGKSAHAEEPSHMVEDSGMQQDQEFVMGDNDEQPVDKEVTKADWFKKPEQPPTPDPDWSKRKQVDFRPPQTWISQAAYAEEPPTSFDELNDTSFDFSVFVMNRLKIPNMRQEILGGDLSRRYSTLVTKIKAATYELKWIEDLVLELWSPVVVKYDQHAYLGTSYWGPKRQSFYGYASNLTSSKDVYSRRRIIAVTRLKIMKKSNLRNKTAYTSHSYPHGIIYMDQYNRKRLIRTDELHKFSDCMLYDVRTALHHIAAGIRMEYLPMRKWSNLDKKRVRVMVQDIDKQLYQRRLMRNLEKFVGGRIYGKDLRLLERTI